MPPDTPVTRPTLETALDTLRARGLELRRGGEAPAPGRALSPLPTGQPALDSALVTGGWPRGALVALDAPRGGGATSLALGSLAACQASGGVVAWLDGEGSFDPAIAARAGIDLAWLLVARPRHPGESVALAAWLGRDGLIDAFVLDLGTADAPRAELDRLAGLLARSGTVGLLPALRSANGGAAGVRVALRRAAWLAVGNDLVGQRIVATVERQHWALAGGRAELDLWFAEGRRIDPLVAVLAEPHPLERHSSIRAASA